MPPEQDLQGLTASTAEERTWGFALALSPRVRREEEGGISRLREGETLHCQKRDSYSQSAKVEKTLQRCEYFSLPSLPSLAEARSLRARREGNCGTRRAHIYFAAAAAPKWPSGRH